MYASSHANLGSVMSFFFNSLTSFPDGPSLSCGPSYEVEENDVLQTVCEPDGMPPPVVAWIRDGKEMESSHLWKKDDRGNYLLRATNAHGTADHELYLDVLCTFQHSVFSKYSWSGVRLTQFQPPLCRCSTFQQGQFHCGGDPGA